MLLKFQVDILNNLLEIVIIKSIKKNLTLNIFGHNGWIVLGDELGSKV